MVTVYNSGERTFHLKDGKDKDGNPVKRALGPGQSIEALDDAESKDLLGYPELKDVEKMVKPISDRIQALEQERDELKAQVADLKKKLKKYEKE